MLESDLEVEGMDYRWALIYLAMTTTPVKRVDQKLQDVIPRKRSKAGKKPTVLTSDVDEKKERWWYPTPPGLLTRPQKRKILAAVLEQMTVMVFNTHVYEWQGQFYRQRSEGPIGLRST